jgi:hypothetical protein
MGHFLPVLLLIIFRLGHTQISNHSTEIVPVLKEDYKTMVTHEINRHKSLCTQDYLLIENGEIWTIELKPSLTKRRSIGYRKK